MSSSVIGFLFGRGWLWGRRRPEIKPSEKQPLQHSPKSTPGLNSGEGKVTVTVNVPGNRYAWMTREDGKGDVFVTYDDATRFGVEIEDGKVFYAKWDKDPHPKKDRLRATHLRAA